MLQPLPSRARRAILAGAAAFTAAYPIAFAGLVPAPYYQPKLGSWSIQKVPDTINMGWYGVVAVAAAAGVLGFGAGWAATAPTQASGPDAVARRLGAATLALFLASVAFISYEMGREWLFR